MTCVHWQSTLLELALFWVETVMIIVTFLIVQI